MKCLHRVVIRIFVNHFTKKRLSISDLFSKFSCGYVSACDVTRSGFQSLQPMPAIAAPGQPQAGMHSTKLEEPAKPISGERRNKYK